MKQNRVRIITDTPRTYNPRQEKYIEISVRVYQTCTFRPLSVQFCLKVYKLAILPLLFVTALLNFLIRIQFLMSGYGKNTRTSFIVRYGEHTGHE